MAYNFWHFPKLSMYKYTLYLFGEFSLRVAGMSPKFKYRDGQGFCVQSYGKLRILAVIKNLEDYNMITFFIF